MNALAAPYRRLCENEQASAVLDSLWQAGDRGRTETQLGPVACTCGLLRQHGLIEAPDGYWVMSVLGERIWRAWHRETGVRIQDPGVLTPPFAVRLDGVRRNARSVASTQMVKSVVPEESRPQPADGRTPQSASATDGFVPNHARDRVAEDGDLLSMLYKVSESYARSALRARLIHGPPHDGAQLVVLLLKLELLGLVDAEFRLTDTGGEILDSIES